MAGLKPRKDRGFTLVELLITTIILGVMMAASVSVYVAAQRFFNGLLNNDERVFAPALAMESVLRRAQVANSVIFDGANNQIMLRIDPALTPDNFGDDVWVKYRVIANRLRWRQDATSAAIVTGGDPEVEAGLVLQGGSGFAMQNPTGAGFDAVIQVTLVTQIGTPAVNTTLRTSVAVSTFSKN